MLRETCGEKAGSPRNWPSSWIRSARWTTNPNSVSGLTIVE